MRLCVVVALLAAAALALGEAARLRDGNRELDVEVPMLRALDNCERKPQGLFKEVLSNVLLSMQS